MQKMINGLSGIVLLAILLAAFPVGAAGTADLVNLLVQDVGVTPQQAEGGAGAIFATAKQNMTPEGFGELSSAIPGIDSLIAAAPTGAAGGGDPMSQGLAAASGMLGGGSGGGGSPASALSLANSFSSLGMNTETMNQFVPTVLDYVQQEAGTGTMELLQGALF